MTRLGPSIVAVATLMLCLSGAASAASPQSKTFRDWIAGCDNLKSCTALSLPGEVGEPAAFLKLTRPAGTAGEPRLELKLRAEKLPSTLAITLTVDGAAFPAAGKRWTATSVDGETADITLSPAETQALIAAARKADKLGVAVADRRFDVSLAGSVAALLWIDEQQGRLDTTSALIRKGPGATSPAAPALPVIVAKGTAAPAIDGKAAKTLTTALRNELKRLDPDLCEDAPEDIADADSVWPLGGGARLVGLLCSRGAYNLSTGFWIVPGADVGKARKALFPQFDGKPDNMLVNADYDAGSGQISFYNRGRGMGDCGASGNYAWTGSGFAMTAFQAMDQCRGIISDDWITLFRSEVKVVR
jgi:hypothetical protein